MTLETRSFQYGKRHYIIAEAPMSFILPMVEANEHDKIIRRIMETYTFEVSPETETLPEGAKPLGESVYDRFGMRGYKALMALTSDLNGLDTDEEEDDEGAQDSGNPET